MLFRVVIRIRAVVLLYRVVLLYHEAAPIARPKPVSRALRIADCPIPPPFSRWSISLPAWNHVQHTTINRQDFSVDVMVACKEEHTHSDLLVSTSSHHRHMTRLLDLLLRKVALLTIVGLRARHFRREVPWCDAADSRQHKRLSKMRTNVRAIPVHPNLRLLELRTHQLAQMHRRSLGSIVREVALRIPHQS